MSRVTEGTKVGHEHFRDNFPFPRGAGRAVSESERFCRALAMLSVSLKLATVSWRRATKVWSMLLLSPPTYFFS